MSTVLRLFLTSLLLLGLLTREASAQAAGGMGSPQFGSDPLLKEVYKKFPGFSGEARIDMQQQGTPLTLFIDLAMLDGSTRTRMDLRRLQSPDMAPGSIERMVELGYNPLISIALADKGLIYIIYPTLKAYASQQYKAPRPYKIAADAKFPTTELGMETVSSHPCQKRRVLIPVGPGKTREVVVWLAKDLQDFPIKIEYKSGPDPIAITFLSVKLEAPAASEFTPPEGFTDYPDVQSLMQAEMMKSM